MKKNNSSKNQKKSLQHHIDKVKENADQTWFEEGLLAVKKVARRRETLISADVLDELEKSEAQTHDLRAIGPVMVEAKKLGYIESAGLVRRSDDHTRGATTLWRSLIRTAGNHGCHSNNQSKQSADTVTTSNKKVA